MTDHLHIPALAAPRSGGSQTSSDRTQAARDAALKLEATFLAEMLKTAGVGTSAGQFSGGIGEDQFASFQRQALAEEMVKSGGIGLAESFYQAMLEKMNDQ